MKLHFWTLAHKMSRRDCDWSHYPVRWWDRLIVRFLPVLWCRSPAGRVLPYRKNRKWTYYYKLKDK